MMIIMLMMTRYEQVNVRQKWYISTCSCHKECGGRGGVAVELRSFLTLALDRKK
jgi:hypothetical protein